MEARLALAVAAGKLTGALARRAGRGGGTALPGLVAERIEPQTVSRLGVQCGRGAILITGTNGKTTTARLLAAILEEAGWHTVHNREGSNLMRGIASALTAAASASGRIPRGEDTLALIETDEATLPHAVRALRPRAVVFTNLFRDQLDRYGEVESVAALWREALADLPPEAVLVLNADDPSVAELTLDWGGAVHWFGVEDRALAEAEPGPADARWCRACGASFTYDRRYAAHLGWWRCPGCGRERPPPETAATEVALAADGARFTVPALGAVALPLTGVSNVANALAATAAGRVLGVDADAIVAGLSAARPAFGRQEVVTLAGRRLRLLLGKNPAGSTEALRVAGAMAPPLRVAVLLNDRFADGRDVSWIWDVDYERLGGDVAVCWTGGDRAEDAALRLRYAGWPAASAVAHDPGALLDAILRDTAPGDEIAVLPTYTALLAIRAELARRGAAAAFWERGS